MKSRFAIKFGVEALREDGFERLKGRRVGLLTHPAAVDAEMVSTYRMLWEAPEVNLVALFSPEHGFASAVADGEKVGGSVDRRTGLPIHSLYGDTLKPTAEMLADIDVLVCDIQDVGVRFYTYIWTISYILEGCGEHGVTVMILDRPNPLGDLGAQGPGLNPEFASFVGRFNICLQHGMTIGELALMMNKLWNPTPCELEIVKVRGWLRWENWTEYDRRWVPTSPAMPNFESVMQYPGSCLIEGTNLSEGRGTPLPFQIVGAPFIDGEALADRLSERWNYNGLYYRPHTFVPTASKWAGQACHGIQLHLDPGDDDWGMPGNWLLVIQEIRQMYPDQFEWLPPFKEGGLYHFDRLIGNADVRRHIEAGTVMAVAFDFMDERTAFEKQRDPFLLYDTDVR